MKEELKDQWPHKSRQLISLSQKTIPEKTCDANQPHSEIAALALLLHEYQKGAELKRSFPRAKIKIRPCAKGKDIVEK